MAFCSSSLLLLITAPSSQAQQAPHYYETLHDISTPQSQQLDRKGQHVFQRKQKELLQQGVIDQENQKQKRHLKGTHLSTVLIVTELSEINSNIEITDYVFGNTESSEGNYNDANINDVATEYPLIASIASVKNTFSTTTAYFGAKAKVSINGTSDEIRLGESYCTWSPNTDCYVTGWPHCCSDNEGEDCPEKQPECEVERTTDSTISVTPVTVAGSSESAGSSSESPAAAAITEPTALNTATIDSEISLSIHSSTNELCTCSPLKYDFVLSLSQSCNEDDLKENSGIGLTLCVMDIHG